MKIYIDQIPDTGLELRESCDPSQLDLDRADIKFNEAIDTSAWITKGTNNITVELKINAIMHLDCSRCLEGYTIPLSKQVKLNFPIKNEKVIDLINNLREEIILSYPLKPLCKQNCLGLCQNCGQNLNKGKCNCQMRPKLTERSERKFEGRI